MTRIGIYILYFHCKQHKARETKQQHVQKMEMIESTADIRATGWYRVKVMKANELYSDARVANATNKNVTDITDDDRVITMMEDEISEHESELHHKRQVINKLKENRTL